ncbi:hypothetical protein BHM03_00008961 [Ensete ventricosum]|nr:hypothetical protein BHM03_00008961 [Ensete ventricosum]
MHTISPVSTTSSGASDLAPSGCASTTLMLVAQWSLGLSSSWAFKSPLPLTLSSLTLPPIMPTT